MASSYIQPILNLAGMPVCLFGVQGTLGRSEETLSEGADGALVEKQGLGLPGRSEELLEEMKNWVFRGEDLQEEMK
jgi:hypothetical protein